MRNTLLTLMILVSFGVFAETKHQETQPADPILIDVRTDAEWNDGYIETAIHIPLDKILEKIELVTTNKEQTIYLYCTHRSYPNLVSIGRYFSVKLNIEVNSDLFSISHSDTLS
mgnify:CR=1 FL=1